MERKKWIAVAAGVGLLALVVVASLRARGGGETVRVYAEKAARRDITQTVEASGQIQPRVRVNISAHVIGRIEKLYVEEGQTIAAGEPFLELEREAYLAARDDARARLALAETERRRCEVELADQRVRVERARRLAGEGIAAQESLEAAELQLASAELQVRSAREGIAQARALLVKAEDDLHKTTIWSPLAGRVVALHAEQGEVVVSGTMNNPASVIGTVADLSELLAELDVDETEIVHVRVGLEADVLVDALPEERLPGKVVEVGSSGYARPQQPDVQFFRVKVLLDRADERLRPGMSTRAAIRVATREAALVVPIQAVVERAPAKAGATETAESGTTGSGEEVPVVFVVADGRARQRSVGTGIADPTHLEIVDGIAEGDEVVTGPYRALRRIEDGDRVRIASAGSERDEGGRRRDDE
jgi:HlyD family secretion protein